ncbi:hypothetical protein BDK51DRAFT_51236, partial [Blyttiomyces helicus]
MGCGDRRLRAKSSAQLRREPPSSIKVGEWLSEEGEFWQARFPSEDEDEDNEGGIMPASSSVVAGDGDGGGGTIGRGGNEAVTGNAGVVTVKETGGSAQSEIVTANPLVQPRRGPPNGSTAGEWLREEREFREAVPPSEHKDEDEDEGAHVIMPASRCLQTRRGPPYGPTVGEWYLHYADYRATVGTFDTECGRKGRPIEAVDSGRARTARAGADESRFLLSFRDGDRESFFAAWDERFPPAVRKSDTLYQKLEFTLNIYFCVFPIHPGVAEAASRVRGPLTAGRGGRVDGVWDV